MVFKRGANDSYGLRHRRCTGRQIAIEYWSPLQQDGGH